jgi:hypothetical protein
MGGFVLPHVAMGTLIIRHRTTLRGSPKEETIIRISQAFSVILLSILTLHSGLLGQSARADDHLVTSADLHKMLLDSADSRERDAGKIQKFLSSDTARRALGENQHLLQKVEKALPYLSDEELKRLASQTEQIEQDVAAGSLTNQQLTYIIIALAVAVIILVIIAA